MPDRMSIDELSWPELYDKLLTCSKTYCQDNNLHFSAFAYRCMEIVVSGLFQDYLQRYTLPTNMISLSAPGISYRPELLE